MRNPVEIDHIDPRWKEGRDYQLVCGLETPINFAERDQIQNVRKSNRFLPWRVAKDEVGSVPVNPGDLCLFLNTETGDWVLEEFMGEWWFEQTKLLCGNTQGCKTQLTNQIGMFNPNYAPQRVQNSRRNGIRNRDLQKGIFDPKHRQAILDGSARENERRMKAVVVIDPEGKKHYHKSVNGAARAHGLSAGNLCSVLKGQRNHTLHYTAYYENV